MGMATAICDALESNCKARPLVTYASITAKPFFEARGYEVWQENWVERRSIILKNYRMEKMKEKLRNVKWQKLLQNQF